MKKLMICLLTLCLMGLMVGCGAEDDFRAAGYEDSNGADTQMSRLRRAYDNESAL